jgi:hypothetical protein
MASRPEWPETVVGVSSDGLLTVVLPWCGLSAVLVLVLVLVVVTGRRDSGAGAGRSEVRPTKNPLAARAQEVAGERDVALAVR